MMLPQEIIRLKRNGHQLTTEQIEKFILSIKNEETTDAQIAAFCMAVYFNPLTIEERVSLTHSMANSGTVIDWAKYDIDQPIVDKHSSGGVGDKVSFILSPILAACQCANPMIAGRGLGHTGGTIDKLESIPGYNPFPSHRKFIDITKKIGCCIIGQTNDLVPADQRIYAVRDTTATIESLDLITSSILSKKIAAGLQTLVMDIKVGSGAFIENIKDARLLASSIVTVAKSAGLKCSALITDMNQPLGHTVGNALEIKASIEFLQSHYQDERLKEVTLQLCAEILYQASVVDNLETGYKNASKALQSGKALEKFAQMLSAMGAPTDFIENHKRYLAVAPVIRPVYANKNGYIASCNNRDIGIAVVAMGGGRVDPRSNIDHRVGFSDLISFNDYVDTKDKPLGFVHAPNESIADKAAHLLRDSFHITPEPAKDNLFPLIYDTIR